MDVIRVLGMTFAGRHGVHAEEKVYPQRFEVDVEISGDFSLPAESGRLDDTVNYSLVVSVVRGVMEGDSCDLIERLAGKIMERMGEFVSGGRVIVRVRKPGAPLAVPFRTVEFELEREFSR